MLLQVLEWSGQGRTYRLLSKYAGVPWAQLPHKAKKELLVAADQLDWSFVKDLEQVTPLQQPSCCVAHAYIHYTDIHIPHILHILHAWVGFCESGPSCCHLLVLLQTASEVLLFLPCVRRMVLCSAATVVYGS